jgi:hypothetical protein
VLDILCEQMMLDGQDPQSIRAECSPPMLARLAVADIALHNLHDDAITTTIPTLRRSYRQRTVPEQPWPVVIFVNVFAFADKGRYEGRGSSYLFAQRIPPTRPEQFNSLLVALSEAGVGYSVL